MNRTDALVRDAFHEAMTQAAAIRDGVGFRGYGVIDHRDGDGRILNLVPFANLITTAGDQYYAQKGIVGIAPASAAAPTAVNGMKLGTGTTAAAKSGAGAAATGTFVTGSNLAFDSTFPSAAAKGGDTGWNISYKTTWAAGVATNAAIAEAAIVTDQATAANATAANTIARVTFTAINKTASDSLAITWVHTVLGA